MRYLSICSGIEAASVAWHPLGWTPVGFSEIEPFPCALLQHHYPTTPNFGDMTHHANWNLASGTVDLVVGGTPCQSFSVAGLRAGMADPRGNLALTFLAIVDRLRPEWIVWENVPGVLSSNGGRDFGTFLGALAELGYGFAYRILDAQYFGVAQRRRRVFVVANATDWRRAAAVLLEPEGMRGNLAPRRAKGQGTPRNLERSAHGNLEVMSTLCAADDAKWGSNQWVDEGKAIVAKTSDGLDAVSATVTSKWAKRTGGPAGNECQNLVAARAPWSTFSTPAIGHLKGDHLASTLTRNTGEGGGETQNPAFVVAPAPVVIDRAAFNQGAEAQYEPRIEASETMSALVARGPHAVAAPFVKAKRAHSAVDDETWEADRPAPTLSAFDNGDTRATVTIVTPAPIAIAFEPGVAAREGGSSRFSVELAPTLRSKAGDNQPAVAQAYAVRRLTPTECERLQGFPDDWTAVPHRGKPAADGPRYKAIGNSMAVPVMRWIGQRIAAVAAAVDVQS